jgi:hypothetical protein
MKITNIIYAGKLTKKNFKCAITMKNRHMMKLQKIFANKNIRTH